MLPTQLSLFIVVANNSSFSSAARELGVSPVAVSKGIAQLEKQLNIRLFHRTTHQFALTDEGRMLFERAEPLVSQLEGIVDDVGNLNRNPAGEIRVNLPESFGREIVLPVLGDFLATYPEIELDLVFDDRVLDPIEEGFDVSIGNKINEVSRIIARPIYQLQVGLYASKSYLANSPAINQVEDLHQHKAIIYKQLSTNKKLSWRLYNNDRQIVQIMPKPALTVSNIDAVRVAAAEGFGVAAIGSWRCHQYVEQGLLEPILKEYWPDGAPIWLYYTSKKNLPYRVRLLIDYLVEHPVFKLCT
ncbi:LysR family transcriptional regulator [Thalassotalea loyana]|uniref:LysR family transcriptional regulator n=1 Tax=Thalassotalea loyana TaxID=280483 RepID=A0ABQ6HF28_9GAMM|nr:LysR family transcriptional regulator [Thalassotalea loyana]GLX85486.1 LysR family transcriptional regulator [Thalassotalea loyana]